MTKITILLICISLIVRFVYPQISFSREWVRSRSDGSSFGTKPFNSKMRKSGNPVLSAFWYPVYRHRNLLNDDLNYGVDPHFRRVDPSMSSSQVSYLIHPVPTFRNSAKMLMNKKSVAFQGNTDMDLDNFNYQAGTIDPSKKPTATSITMALEGNSNFDSSPSQSKSRQQQGATSSDFDSSSVYSSGFEPGNNGHLKDQRISALLNSNSPGAIGSQQRPDSIDYYLNRSDKPTKMDWMEQRNQPLISEFLDCILTWKLLMQGSNNENDPVQRLTQSHPLVSQSDLDILVKLRLCSPNPDSN